MSASIRPARCGFCGSRFCQRPGPGRPRRYCDTACRRRAQRQRDAARTRAADPPADAQTAAQLRLLLTRLLHAEQQPQSLGALLALAAGIDEESRRYAAAQQAVGLGPGGTHARWNPVKEIQPPSAATPFSRPEPSPRERSRAARRLGAALTQLRAGSQSTLRDAARQTGLPLSVTAQVLSGAYVPPWPVVHLLATVFQGEPADLRALWESSQGRVQRSRQSAEGTDHSADEVGVQACSALGAPAALDETVRAEDLEAAEDGVEGDAVPVLRHPRQAGLGRGHGASGFAGLAEDLAVPGPLHHGVVAVLRQAVDDLLVVLALEVFCTEPGDDPGVHFPALEDRLRLLAVAEFTVEQGEAIRCQLVILRVERARRGAGSILAALERFRHIRSLSSAAGPSSPVRAASHGPRRG
uniref:helix-turn-helix domain-containing protein n=1 Tax=Streptomyces sp. CA-136453 TaxID=3240050 RepID=UPI003F49092D